MYVDAGAVRVFFGLIVVLWRYTGAEASLTNVSEMIDWSEGEIRVHQASVYWSLVHRLLDRMLSS